MSLARPLMASPRTSPARAVIALLALTFAATVHAVDIGSTEAVTSVQSKTASASTVQSQTSIWSANDATLAQLWSLTVPEVQRARILMQGPRGAFSSPQLSPIEALGIHARTEGERARYARLFAQVTYEDTQRVLAWSQVAEAELQQLAAGQPVLNFDNAPKAAVSNEAADILGVPRSSVVPPKKAVSALKPKPGINKLLGRAVDNRGRPPAKSEGAR